MYVIKYHNKMYYGFCGLICFYIFIKHISYVDLYTTALKCTECAPALPVKNAIWPFKIFKLKIKKHN